MTTEIFRFEFDQEVSLIDVELSLQLALLAVGGLFGDARVRLDAGYFVDEPRHAIVVDGMTEVSAAVVRVFANLLMHELDQDSFRVQRVTAQPNSSTHDRRVSA